MYKLRWLAPLLIAPGLVPQGLAAQGVVAPFHFANAEAGASSTHGVGTRTAPSVYLGIYEDMQGVAASISGVSFRRDGGVSSTTTYLPATMVADIWISTAATAAGNPDPTFANNHGPGQAEGGFVHAGAVRRGAPVRSSEPLRVSVSLHHALRLARRWATLHRDPDLCEDQHSELPLRLDPEGERQQPDDLPARVRHGLQGFGTGREDALVPARYVQLVEWQRHADLQRIRPAGELDRVHSHRHRAGARCAPRCRSSCREPGTDHRARAFCRATC